MTDIRYWDDPYLTSLSSTVATVVADEVTLEQTIFYAFAGGQERDHGTIGGREVLDARWEGPDIVYRLEVDHRLAAGDVVELRIDGERRDALRRLHMATEMVLEVLTQDDPDLVKVGAHIASDKVRIDFESPVTLTERLPRITRAVNAMISADIPITTSFSDATRKRRYWEITGFARVPCAGTLPTSTSEIGRVMLRRKNPGKGRERVEITLVPAGH